MCEKIKDFIKQLFSFGIGDMMDEIADQQAKTEEMIDKATLNHEADWFRR